MAIHGDAYNFEKALRTGVESGEFKSEEGFMKIAMGIFQKMPDCEFKEALEQAFRQLYKKIIEDMAAGNP